jgi:AcrR family transcriptional regulator
MLEKAKRRTRQPGAPRDRLRREDWIRAAKGELIARGVTSVKVKRLASVLRVTRGSFYWHFNSHRELLRALLKDWESTNTEPFERTIPISGDFDGAAAFRKFINLWVEEREYNPAFDTAVRDWARISKEAAQAVRGADLRRIAVLRRIFLTVGYSDPDALVRARITYFHQVGYYALTLEETPEERHRLVPVYTRALLGLPGDRARPQG